MLKSKCVKHGWFVGLMCTECSIYIEPIELINHFKTVKQAVDVSKKCLMLPIMSNSDVEVMNKLALLNESEETFHQLYSNAPKVTIETIDQLVLQALAEEVESVDTTTSKPVSSDNTLADSTELVVQSQELTTS